MFDPSNEKYKSPFGAAETGERITLRIRPKRREGLTSAYVKLRLGDDRGKIPMYWERMDGERDVWRADLRLERPGAYFYSFEPGEEREYQLTVYSPDEGCEAFGEGVCYQIFPDRFARAGGVRFPEGREGFLHENTSDEPVFLPNERGEVTNTDFFGGNLEGIRRSLGYLESLGVETIYLNPIFAARSNHRYDTADYERIDPLLGTEEELARLCREAGERKMRVLLDGVFSHTGSDSRYFRAAQADKGSPYFKWYEFTSWPDEYSCWWGFKTLPQVREEEPGYLAYIKGVVRKWTEKGAWGFRLDVADELPDGFIRALRAELPERPLIGEVWEDATNKVSYGVRREYLLGGGLTGVTNYPLRAAIVSYVLGGGAEAFAKAFETQRENYPPRALMGGMNILGTHDTVRILTALGGANPPESREERSRSRLSPQERARGAARLRLCSAVLYCLPGAPTVYYGDEAGMEGFEDPMNRRFFPWGGEDAGLLAHYRLLGALRKRSAALRRGEARVLFAYGGVLAFERKCGDERAVLLCNASEMSASASVPFATGARDELTGESFEPDGGELRVPLAPVSARILTNI